VFEQPPTDNSVMLISKLLPMFRSNLLPLRQDFQRRTNLFLDHLAGRGSMLRNVGNKLPINMTSCHR
jgi:hypothetical protein